MPVVTEELLKFLLGRTRLFTTKTLRDECGVCPRTARRWAEKADVLGLVEVVDFDVIRGHRYRSKITWRTP